MARLKCAGRELTWARGGVCRLPAAPRLSRRVPLPAARPCGPPPSPARPDRARRPARASRQHGARCHEASVSTGPRAGAGVPSVCTESRAVRAADPKVEAPAWAAEGEAGWRRPVRGAPSTPSPPRRSPASRPGPPEGRRRGRPTSGGTGSPGPGGLLSAGVPPAGSGTAASSPFRRAPFPPGRRRAYVALCPGCWGRRAASVPGGPWPPRARRALPSPALAWRPRPGTGAGACAG